MFENVDGQMADGRTDRVIGILLAHLAKKWYIKQ